MTSSSLSVAQRPQTDIARADALKAACVALFLGLGLVYVAGFSTASVAHNAAHDSRHAQGFPCH